MKDYNQTLMLAIAIAVISFSAYSQMYDPNFPRPIDRPTWIDVHNAERSAHDHDSAANEAMFRGNTEVWMRESQAADSARRDADYMAIRMEQNRREEVRRQEEIRREEEVRREENQKDARFWLSKSPFVNEKGDRLCPICGKKKLKAKQQRCRKCVKLLLYDL